MTITKTTPSELTGTKLTKWWNAENIKRWIKDGQLVLWQGKYDHHPKYVMWWWPEFHKECYPSQYREYLPMSAAPYERQRQPTNLIRFWYEGEIIHSVNTKLIHCSDQWFWDQLCIHFNSNSFHLEVYRPRYEGGVADIYILDGGELEQIHDQINVGGRVS